MKNKMLRLLMLCALLGVFTANASAGPYVSGNLAAVFINDADYSDDWGNGELSFDTGYGLTFALGNALDNGIRLEAEFGYASSDIDKDNYTDDYDDYYSYSESFDADVTTLTWMGNFYYDFCKGCTFSTFIGAGIGFANIELDSDYYTEDDTVFAYQLALGGSFAVSSAVNLDVQYRFFGTEDPEVIGIEAEYTAHKIMVGVRCSF